MHALIVVGFVLFLGIGWYGLSRSNRTAAPAPAVPSAPPAVPTKPATTPEQQRAAKEALTALKALESITSAGVTYQEYMRRLGDTKIRVDQASEQIEDSEIQVAIGRAMLYYEVTGSVWNAKIQRHDVGGYLRIYARDCQLLSHLINRSDRDKYPSIALEVEGVSTMMTCAARKVAEASRLIEHRPQ